MTSQRLASLPTERRKERHDVLALLDARHTNSVIDGIMKRGVEVGAAMRSPADSFACDKLRDRLPTHIKGAGDRA